MRRYCKIIKLLGTLFSADSTFFDQRITSTSPTPPYFQHICDKAGAVVEIKARFAHLPPDGKRPRGNVHWVPDGAVPVEVRLYDHLFSVPLVTANWEKELNRESEVILCNSLVDPSVLSADGALPVPETHFQFERVGIFVVDRDSGGKLIVNRTVPLKVAKSARAGKTAEEEAKEAKRRADQETAIKHKQAMSSVDPREMFKIGEEASKYSKWDAQGIPTHDFSGEPLSKSSMKKLKKDWDKQKKLFEKGSK